MHVCVIRVGRGPEEKRFVCFGAFPTMFSIRVCGEKTLTN